MTIDNTSSDQHQQVLADDCSTDGQYYFLKDGPKIVQQCNDECEAIDYNVEAAPEGGWGWCVVIGCMIAHVIAVGFTRSIGVFYLQFLGIYNQSAEVTSWAVSISYMLMNLLAPLASVLCNRFTTRAVVSLGATLCTAGILLSGISSNIICLYFNFGILPGIGLALMYGPSLIILGHYFNKRRSLVTAIATSSGAFSSMLIPEMLEALFSHYGFFGTFLILGAITSHVYIAAALYRPIELHWRFLHQDRRTMMLRETSTHISDMMKTESFSQRHVAEQRQTPLTTPSLSTKQNIVSFEKTNFKISQQSSSVNKTNKRPQILLDLSLLRNCAFLCLCVQMLFFPLSYACVFTYLPALASENGFDSMHGAYLISIIGGSDVTARIIVSIILDLDGIRPYRPIIYNINIFALAAVTLVIPFMSTFSEFCIVSVLYGLTSGLYQTQKSVVPVDILGVEHLVDSMGLLLWFQGAGTVVAPTVGGLLKDIFDSYNEAFYVGAIATFLGGCIMTVGNMWMYRRKHHSYQSL